MSVDTEKLKALATAASKGAAAHAEFSAAANPAAVLELITELERCRESATRQTGERIVRALEAMIPAIRGEETAQFLRDLVAEWRGPGGTK